MNDQELIQALRHCASGDEYICLRCTGEATCDECSGKTVLDAADRLETMLDENEHLREVTKMVPKWRPASEPPKTSETVFARDMVGVVTTAYYNGNWHGMLNCDAVTHWMPLPSTEGVE